ncbi:MAG: hypothetical protein ABI165_01770, partial [Bryobacteraceae bacterium]
VADRLHAVLAGAKKTARNPPAEPAADLSGEWNVHIEFAAGSSDHTLSLRQQGSRITGVHQGDFISRDIYGSIDGDAVKLLSQVGESHGFALTYRFTGVVQGDSISGPLDLGEYRSAKWTATRHHFGRA